VLGESILAVANSIIGSLSTIHEPHRADRHRWPVHW
jgi:hypothetical protein